MSGGGDDWSDSLFKPEKGDSLGDGSWGRSSDEPKLAPVAWDKLPEAPNKNKVRARLATPAPGSQKESGLLDIKTLAPDLAKGMNPDGTAKNNAPAQGGSGLINVQDLVKTQQELANSGAAATKTSRDPSMDVIANNAAASMKGAASKDSNSLSRSRDDQTPIPLEDSLPIKTSGGQGPLMAILVVLAVAVAGLAYYVLTQ